MPLIKIALFTTDICMLALAFWAGQYLAGTEAITAATDIRLHIFVIATLFGLARWAVSLSHYSIRRPFWDELRGVLTTLLGMMLIDASYAYLRNGTLSTPGFMITWGSAMLLVPLGRIGIKLLLLRAGYWQRDIVLIGSAQQTLSAWKALSSDHLLGYRLRQLITPNAQADWAPASVTQTRLDNDGAWLRAIGTQLVVIALDESGSKSLESIVRRLSATQVEYIVIPTALGLPMYGLETQHMFSHDLLILHAFNRSAQLPARIAKRAFDILGASTLLILLSPLLLWLSWQVSRSGRPVIFRHARVGLGGKSMPCPKFRTMVPNAQQVLAELLEKDSAARDEWEKEFKLRNDPRITEIGQLLRKSSLDELPQLWSVLIGDMSLVGPRPVTPEELVRYGDNATYYTQVRPGMTGLWQVSGRNDIDYRTRVALDVWYVRNWSLWYDIAILFKTISVVLNRNGAY